MPDLNDPMMPVLGVMVVKAQDPPSGLTDDQALHWRTGYQNAAADLIRELWPDQAGGRRLTAQEIADEDARRKDR